MANGDFVSAHTESKIVYVGVGSRATFDAIPLPEMDHRKPIGQNQAKELLSKSIDPSAEQPVMVIFQHWLNAAQP